MVFELFFKSNLQYINSCFWISALLLGAGVSTWIISLLVGWIASSLIDEKSDGSWLLRFIYTILGYATVFLPCYVLVHLARKHNLHTLGNSMSPANKKYFTWICKIGGCQWKALRLILTGNTLDNPLESDVKFEPLQEKLGKEETSTLWQKTKSLIFCCAGLQFSYLTWGILQEKIMTRYIQIYNF